MEERREPLRKETGTDQNTREGPLENIGEPTRRMMGTH